jgi:acyl-CoA synthetase (AMP-forming)/AMP-acid ligase II
VPLSHVTGLVGVALSTLIVGGCVVLMRRAYATSDFLALASREKITFSILVPTIYTLCVMSPELAAHDLASWRIGCFGGAPMPVTTIELLSEKLPHLQLLNAYGATETTSPSTIMPRTRWRDHFDSVGITVPCGVVVVQDDVLSLPRPFERFVQSGLRITKYQRQSAFAQNLSRETPTARFSSLSFAYSFWCVTSTAEVSAMDRIAVPQKLDVALETDLAAGYDNSAACDLKCEVGVLLRKDQCQPEA